MKNGIVGFEPQRFVKMFDGFVRLALFGIGAGQEVVGPIRIGGELQSNLYPSPLSRQKSLIS